MSPEQFFEKYIYILNFCLILNLQGCKRKSEFWIIGRGIYLEKNRKEISKKYAELEWSHFLNFNIDFLINHN